MDPIGFLQSALDTANLIMRRVWGEQTSAESQLRKEAEVAAVKKKEAYWLMREAQRNKDHAKVALYLSAYNGWNHRLDFLLAQAAAQRG